MIWSLIFFSSIIQGVLLISVLWLRKPQNKYAAACITGFTLVMILINLDFLYTTSGIYNNINYPFGVSFGSVLLMGPFLFLYASGVLTENFHFKKTHLFHFLPYFIKLFTGFGLIGYSHEIKIRVIAVFLSGQASVSNSDKLMLSLQAIHLCVYIIMICRLIYSKKSLHAKDTFKVPVAKRISWTSILLSCTILFCTSFFIWLLIIMQTGFYNPTADYVNTLISSIAIFVIAYQAMLQPELISPEFKKKNNGNGVKDKDAEKIAEAIMKLMMDEKYFLNADAELKDMSERLQVPAYICSKILNERFNKNFTDFINEYRVEEVKRRLSDPLFASYSILGIAMETGFGSKSSFNTAFKKHTGHTPSEYKSLVSAK